MKELLKNKSALIIWLSRTFSRFGDSFESLALMYLVYEISGSAMAMGTVMIFSVVPNIIVSPFAGAIGDRYDKKKIMFIAESARTVIILLVPMLHVMGVLQLWQIYIMASLVSVAESFFEPCAQVAMTVVVKKEQLALYDSAITTSNHIARMIGYSLSGVAISVFSMDIVFVVDAITFGVSALSAIVMKLPDIQIDDMQEGDTIFKDIQNAFKYIMKNVMIPTILVAIILNNVLITPESEFLPIVIEEFLKVDKSWAGIFLTILSSGSLIASVVFPIITKTKFKLRDLVLIGQAIMGGLFIIASFKPNLVTGIILYIALGFIASLISMWCFMEIQYICKMEYMARVSSVLTIIMLISDPISAAVYGWGMDVISVNNVFFINGLLFTVFGAGIFALMKKANIEDNEQGISECNEEEAV